MANITVVSGGPKFTQAGTGAIQRDMQDKVREAVSLLDFGAVGNDSHDDTSAIQAALAYGHPVLINPGYTFKATSRLNLTTGSSLYGGGPDVSVIKMYSADGIGLTSAALNDGYVSLSGFTLRYGDTAGTNTHRGLDWTGCNYSRVKDVRVEYFKTGLYMQRGAGSEGCYFNTFEDLALRYAKYGVDMNDSVTGTSINRNTFINPHYEDVGTWAGGIAYRVTGYGHAFYAPYGGGFTGVGTRFMEFAEGASPGSSIAGDITVSGAYIESSPEYGFHIPTTTSGRYGITIVGAHFDANASIANYYDPQNNMMRMGTEGVSLDGRGLVVTAGPLGVSGTEPYVTIHGATKDHRIYSGGGSTYGGGQFVVVDQDTGHRLLLFYNGAPDLALVVDDTGGLMPSGRIELSKITDPGAAPANKGELFLRDNGSGKMQIVAHFPSGAIQVIVTEP